MEQGNQINENMKSDEEIDISYLLLSIKNNLTELRKNWKVIMGFCVPFLIWQGYVYFTTPIKYPANLTFMVNEGEGGGLSAISGLLGTFGLGSSGENNYQRILYLAKSERILRETLLSKVKIDGKEDYLGNYLITIHKIQERKWSKSSKNDQIVLKNFLFKRDSFESFNRTELTALKSLYGVLLGSKNDKAIFFTTLDEESGIMKLSVDGQSEDFSIAFLKVLFEKLSNFYVEKTIEKNKATYQIIKSKVDSIRSQMSGVEIQSARFDDNNNSLLLETDKVPRQRFTRDKQILMIMYGEAVKNLELADFALKTKTPYIQTIDEPTVPIKGVPPSKKMALGLALILGLLFGIVAVFVKKVFLPPNPINNI